jgi:hypothetical protein
VNDDIEEMITEGMETANQIIDAKGKKGDRPPLVGVFPKQPFHLRPTSFFHLDGRIVYDIRVIIKIKGGIEAIRIKQNNAEKGNKTCL